MATDAPLMPGYAPLEHLSDEDLDYLLTQHGETQSAMQTLSDEDLQALLRDYEAPEGNIDPENVPVVGAPPPALTAGEELAGGARELAGGALFEFSDEAEAAARAPFSDKSYEDLVNEIRLERSQFGKAHPALAPALNLAGGIGSMLIPGVGAVGRGVQAATGISKLASPLARTVASGALAGGTAGFGSGEGLAGSAQNAVIGTALGTTLGAGAHGLGKLAGWGKGAAGSSRAALGGAEMGEEEATRAAANIINQRIAEGGNTPAGAASLWDLERSYGIPSVLGTVSPELARLTENVVQTPSAGRADLTRKLFEQQSGAPARVASQVKQAVPTPDYFASEESITGALRRNANTAYEKAYAAGDISDGRIMDFMRAPDVQVAYKDALVNAERLKEAAKLRGEDPSQFNLRELFTVDPEGNIVKQNVPDIRTLDYVKQAMDRRISSLYSSGQGSEATALREMRKAFVDTLDTVGPPEYRAARQQYKGDIEIRDALEQGRKSNSLRWQEFNRLMKDYSPGEQQAFKTGFVQNIMQRFENTGNSKNFAKDLLKGNDRRKFEAVMEPGEFQVFEAALKRESELFEEISRTTRGSATFARFTEKNDIEEQIAGGHVENALDLLLNPTPGNIARRTLQALVGLRNANVSRATYTQLSRMLKAGTPDEVDSVLRQLEAAAPEQQAAARVAEGRAGKAATVAASTIAPPPEDTRGQTPATTELVVPSLDEVPMPGTALGAEPIASAPEGGLSFQDALAQIMPDMRAMLGDGSMVSAAGDVIQGADVAKALGIPYEGLLSYLNRGQ
jgi:hypothetical protein